MPNAISWIKPSHTNIIDQLFKGASFSVVQSTTPTLGGSLSSPNNSIFRYRGAGGWAYGASFPDTLMYFPNSKYPNTWGSPIVCGVDFGFTGQQFEVSFKYVGSSAMIRVKVNGQRLTDLLQSTGASTVGSRHYYRVDLGRSVTSATITLELYNVPFGGVAPASGASVSGGLSAFTERVILQGDSITNGSNENTGGGTGTYLLRLADYMSWQDTWNVAIGGTGYVNAGSSVNIADSNRINDVVNWSPTKIILWAGYNDGGSSVTTNASSVVDSYQSSCPGVPIYIIGTYSPAYPAGSSQTSRDTELESVAQTKGCYFISPITGKVRNTAGTLLTTLTPMFNSSGDISAYIGADSVHPSDAGHNYIAKWLYNAFTFLS